jgi:hypothetical protein
MEECRRFPACAIGIDVKPFMGQGSTLQRVDDVTDCVFRDAWPDRKVD